MFIKYPIIIIALFGQMFYSQLCAQEDQKRNITKSCNLFDASSSTVQNSFNKKILQNFSKTDSTKKQASEKLDRFQHIENSRKTRSLPSKIPYILNEDKLKTKPMNVLILVRHNNDITNPPLLSIERSMLNELISGLVGSRGSSNCSLKAFKFLFQKKLLEDYARYTALKEKIDTAVWTKELKIKACISKLKKMCEFDIESKTISMPSIQIVAHNLCLSDTLSFNSFEGNPKQTEIKHIFDKIDLDGNAITLANISSFSKSELAEHVLSADDFLAYSTLENTFRGKEQERVLGRLLE